MSNNKFLANESVSITATKLSAWDNSSVTGEIIPANVPTNPDGTAQAQALTDTQLRATAVPVSLTATTISNFPANQTVNGTVDLGATSLAALESITVQNAAGASAVNIQDGGNSITVDGSVAVSSLPSITGTVTANAGTNLNTSLLALDSTVAKDASLSTLNTSVNTLLKPASTLAAVTAITNTVTIKADTPANQTNALKVDGSAVTQPISNSLETTSTGTITSVANSTSSVSVLASNANRKGFILHNDSTTTVFVAYSATATLTAFTLRLTSQASYFSNQLPIYRGALSAISSAVNGSLRITELT